MRICGKFGRTQIALKLSPALSLWLEKEALVSGAAAWASFGNPAQTHLRPYLARAGVTTFTICRQNSAVGSRPQHAGGEGQCG